MGDALFAPDLFSRPDPEFLPADAGFLEDIRNVLHQHYGFNRQEILSVGKLKGLEINSRNFRVATDSGFYALKCAGPQAQETVMSAQLDVTRELHENGIAVPDIVLTGAGTPYAQDQSSRIWILSRFVEGTYFTGAHQHLLAVARAVRNLQQALENLDIAARLPQSAASGTWPKTTEIFEELFRRRVEWSELFPAAESAALVKEADYLRHSFEKISALQKDFPKNIVPTHIDLHPHNILIGTSESPVIVDIDSLQRADKTQSLAFAGFKLIRQHIVHDRPADRTAPAREFLDIMDEPGMNIKMFGSCAAAEVLRRIGIIADLNVRQANRQWNEVLHMQLAALHEIPHIFKAEG